MNFRAANGLNVSPDIDEYLSDPFPSIEEPAVLIAKYNLRRGDLDLFTQLFRFMSAYGNFGKYDTIAAVLQHFPEFRASNLFISTNFSDHLHGAVKAGSVAFLRLLFEDFGVHYDGDPDRDNLFAEACMYGNLEIMRYLHSISVLPMQMQDKLLLRAFKMGRSDIVRYLHLQFGFEYNDKEAMVQSAYKGKSIDLVEACFYDFGVVSIRTHKTVEYAVSAAACTGDIRFLSTLVDLFTVTYSMSLILPNRSQPKRHHFYYSFLTFAKRNALTLVQYCVEVLKISLFTSDYNSELVNYLDLLTACAANGAADLMCYLLKDVGMKTSLYKRLTGYELSEIVERDWPEYTDKARILGEIAENESKSSAQSDSEEDEVVKKQRFSMS
jgi:hypothetical protein